MLSQRSLDCPRYFSFFFLYSVPQQCFPAFFQLIYLFFFLIYSAIDSLSCIFHFSYCISNSVCCLNFQVFVKHFLYLFALCLHSFFGSWIIFTVISMNSFSVSSSLSCFSGVLSHSLFWNVFVCCLILSNFLFSVSQCRIVLPLSSGVCL